MAGRLMEKMTLITEAGSGMHAVRRAHFDQVVAVNLKGVFLGCRYALPVMLEQGRGVILSTSSVAVAYGPFGIRANCVCPGDVDTSLDRELFRLPARSRGRTRAGSPQVPLRRIAEPAEVGQVLAFLASDDASFTIGSHILVDGGLLADVYEPTQRFHL